MFERQRSRVHLPVAVIVAGMVLLIGVGSILLVDWQTERELRQMPSDARHALFENVREALHRSCSHANGEELRDYCQRQAQFLARFPECGAACQDLCKQYTPRPTK